MFSVKTGTNGQKGNQKALTTDKRKQRNNKDCVFFKCGLFAHLSFAFSLLFVNLEGHTGSTVL